MIQTFANQGVDAIQTAKKQFVNTFIQHEQLKNVLNGFVDAQSEYTKSAIDAGVKASASTMEIFVNPSQYTDTLKKFQSFFDKSTFSKKSK